jgi:hypothetical protein
MVSFGWHHTKGVKASTTVPVFNYLCTIQTNPSRLHLLLRLIYNGEMMSTVIDEPGNNCWGGRISMIDLLVLTSLDQLLFRTEKYFFCYKTSYLNEVNRTEPSLSVRVHWLNLSWPLGRDDKPNHPLWGQIVQGILKGEVSLYSWPPVWLVWISLFCK